MTARRGVALTPMETRRDVIVRAAVLADRLGYELFVVPEGWGLDSTLVLTEIALRTTAIRLASGVLSVWGRTPATLAMSAATLHQVSGGRYILGLGASTQALAEGFHGVPFEHPARRLRDTVAGVRALLTGQPAQLGQSEAGLGPGAAAARPLRLGQPPAPEVPIWVAALGEHTLRVAAELADGWFPAFVTRDSVPAWAARLSARRAAAVPGAAPLTIVSGPIAAVGESAAAAREVVATCLAWYLAAMGDIYRRVLSGQGYAAEVEAILAANPRPSPRHGTVPPAAEPLLGQLTAYGTIGEVRERLAPWEQDADIVTLLLPPGLPWPAIEATLLAAAPDSAPEPRSGGGLAVVTRAAP
jgi:alkanesulfonate monooxygenase SsuD/methylene tetrahydromethanopterin reductase-like flavin-dependent oxidoreductase (luciferase family)